MRPKRPKSPHGAWRQAHTDGDTKERPTALAAGISAPTALVSWAHRGEGWSDEEAAKWTQEVVEFTAGLRANGIDADLDLFHAHEAAIDWTRFGPAAVERADYVIVAISEAWAQRWSGANSANVGAGAVAEADALRGLFQVDQNHWQRKVMLVVLPSQDDAAIPKDLMRASRFWVDPEDADSFESLVRTLTGQPLYDKPALGRVPVLPPTVAASLGVSDKRSESAESAEFEDYSAVLDEVKRSSTKPKSAIANDRLALLMGLLDALSN
ncbi:hypothetical protein [Ornithinimicrobium sp. INDO-MA30-4]|uniref:hypothetical protein n=1 Tax=Ornithinimicrobium sp. INDO-MA30-4 TaxID=2908651 RepID=UPI001F4579DA|nr:hypothetical protein [Ornithinimicrobium sp. INDO-MA30-4]UJH70916.1 hypothetical protein L0A91_02800 [Ornithinimicrobium sp. INDO-MA30-4]